MAGVHDKQRRRAITAFPKQNHWTLESFNRAVKNQDRLTRHEQTGMIVHDIWFSSGDGLAMPRQYTR
jgi:hypothetical protein